MNYFENLPSIEYSFTDVDQLVKMRNIFNYLDLSFISTSVTKLYRINGTSRLDLISHELYGTADYWWIIALLNNIQDIIFDLPVDEALLREIASRKMLEVYNTILDSGALSYFNTVFDTLVLENDAKRKILVIDRSYIGRVITEIMKRF